jgi:hypothetical protein
VAAASGNSQGTDPSPNQDLSPILKRLMATCRRKTEAARRRLANSDLTKDYLEAGLNLIAAQCAAPAHTDDDTEDSNEAGRPFFAWLSRELVVNEVTRRRGIQATAGSLRDRWYEQPDYVEDLLSYALWSQHWSLHVSNAQESKDLLTSDPDFVCAIHVVAYNDLCILLKNPAYRVSLIAAAVADRDSTVKEAVGESYQTVRASWQQLYEATLAARGLKLRPGVSFAELTDILTALAEGIGMRMLADPNATVIDHERKESLLGKAALAIAAACIDSGDGKSLEEVVSLLGQAAQAAR